MYLVRFIKEAIKASMRENKYTQLPPPFGRIEKRGDLYHLSGDGVPYHKLIQKRHENTKFI